MKVLRKLCGSTCLNQLVREWFVRRFPESFFNELNFLLKPGILIERYSLESGCFFCVWFGCNCMIQSLVNEWDQNKIKRIVLERFLWGSWRYWESCAKVLFQIKWFMNDSFWDWVNRSWTIFTFLWNWAYWSRDVYLKICVFFLPMIRSHLYDSIVREQIRFEWNRMNRSRTICMRIV